MKMDLIMERCPGVISIHDDIVVYGVSDEDHDANLINLLNVAQVGSPGTEQQEIGAKMPKGLILWCRVQHQWHVPLSEEDTGNN